MKKFRQDNLIVGSDTLFLPRHRDGFYNLFKNDHDIFMLESHKTRDNDQLVQSLQNHLSSDYNHRVYIGSKQDVYLLFDLYLNHNIAFDAAVLINGSYSGTIYMDPRNYRYKELSQKLPLHTKIYNLYGKLPKYESLEFASINQQIPTVLPPQMSSRFSLEAYGLVVYDHYGQSSLSSSVGRLSYL